MSRKLVSIILVTFVIATMFSIVRVATLIEDPIINEITYDAEDVMVGVYYYVWYMGNWTENHGNCVDRPIIEEYNSQNATVIKKHLDWLTELDVDFLIVSWWGANNDKDDATKLLFSEALAMARQNSSYSIEIAIMVEPFTTSWIEAFNSATGNYNFTKIYDYIYDTFVSPYAKLYMTLYQKPLICFYNDDENLTRNGYVPLDERFEVRTVGHQPYVNWVYWGVDITRWRGDSGKPDFLGQREQKLCMDGEINVMPRYDDEHFRPGGHVPLPIDQDYKGGLYDEQWSKAIQLAREGKVSIVTITSWNEFPERTAIEPHWDITAHDPDPYFLYNKTKEYINILKGIFTFFVKEILETVADLGENQCRYNAKDNWECGLDAIKIIENPEGGYLGVYHSNVSKILKVRLANSTDLLRWTFIRTIDEKAAQPTIAKAPNNAYIVAFEKENANYTHLRFQYYLNLSSLIIGTPDITYDANRTLSSSHEGTPNVYNVTIEGFTLSACIGFHYDDGSADNAAVGWLTIPLDNPQNMIWNNTKPVTRHNQDLRDKYQVKGNIGDRDYGQIFGRNFTLQEGNLEERSPDTNWTAWRTFLYDHSTNNFTMLNIKTHKGSTSFGNPTFTFLKSPNGKDCIVVTYFLFSEGAKSGEAGELIFYKEFETEPFNLTYEDKPYFVNVTSNSTITDFDFNETCISFNVSGLNASKGFCIIEIPKELVQNIWQDNYTVLLKGKEWSFGNWTYEESTYIYVNYINSTHKLLIITEFPSFLVLPLFMIATPLAVIAYRRKHSM